MKKLLPIFLLPFLAITAKAQLGYDFSTYTQAYAPLTGATSLNNTDIWDEELYSVPLPFPYMIGDYAVDSFHLASGITVLSTGSVFATTNSFTAMNADLWDRGGVTNAATLSPIRYQVTGTTPNRIFKAEVSNAGFWDEDFSFGTNNDFVTYQVWLYETSNTFEIHYGNSSVPASHFSVYFDPSSTPLVGYSKHRNVTSLDMAYYLKGSAASPTVDSTTNPMSITSGINGMPTSGTVYRFTMGTTGINDVKGNLQVAIYPTNCTNELFVTNNEQEAISYQVFSVNGSAAGQQATLAKGSNRIDVSTLAPGLYLIRLQGQAGSETMKFSKL